jgi:hypothetical protein
MYVGKNDNHCIVTSHLYHADDEPMTDYCVHKKSVYREAVSIMQSRITEYVVYFVFLGHSKWLWDLKGTGSRDRIKIFGQKLIFIQVLKVASAGFLTFQMSL